MEIYRHIFGLYIIINVIAQIIIEWVAPQTVLIDVGGAMIMVTHIPFLSDPYTSTFIIHSINQQKSRGVMISSTRETL